MEWNARYGADNVPSFDEIERFVNNDLWRELNVFLQSTYHVQPKLCYSCCSAQPGWNVKYQKCGKSLCTLYPMDGFFIALVVIGNKESQEVELAFPTYHSYTKDLYRTTAFSAGGRWLMMRVTSMEVLSDVIRLIQARVRPK